jgi:hypothetical protein
MAYKIVLAVGSTTFKTTVETHPGRFGYKDSEEDSEGKQTFYRVGSLAQSVSNNFGYDLIRVGRERLFRLTPKIARLSERNTDSKIWV